MADLWSSVTMMSLYKPGYWAVTHCLIWDFSHEDSL